MIQRYSFMSLTALLDNALRDLRHGARRLSRDWRFTAGAVLILALGIGATTAVFSLVNAVLFKPQRIADPSRLVDLYQQGVNRDGVDGNTYPAYLEMAAEHSVFEEAMAFTVPLGVRYMDGGTLRPAVAEHATSTYLAVLGLQPAMGRWFTAAEDAQGAEVVAVVGHTAWMRRFGADPAIVGRTLRIEGTAVRIIGVGPVGHAGSINVGVATDFWLPVQALHAFGAGRMLERRPAEAGFFVKARLLDGVQVAQAQAAMDVLGKRLAAEHPAEDPGQGIRVVASSSVRVHPQLDTVLRWMAAVLLSVVALILAIACTNLATLTLVRGAAGARDVSLRLALGATRGQLVRQMLTESLLIAAAGGVAGALVAWWAVRWLGAIDLPVVVDVHVDGRVLLFATVLAMSTGLAFGLAPARHAAQVEIVPTLRDEGVSAGVHRWFRLKHVLIVGQVAVSVLLLGITSMVVQMLDVSRAKASGFAVDGVAILETDARYAGADPAGAGRLYDEFHRRVAALPGVLATTVTRGRPMETGGRRIVPDGREADGREVLAGSVWASPGFFETLQIPVLAGRPIDARDHADGARVAVISETLAREAFGSVNAVGRRFRFEQEADSWIEVIGVARDTGTADLAGDLVDPTPRLFYRPVAQGGEQTAATVVARTGGDAGALLGAMQRTLVEVDPMLPAIDAQTMQQVLDASLAGSTAVAGGLTALGLLGLCLAGLGLYSVVAFAVSQRAREIGIRMALGAHGPQVVWTVSREVAALVGVGTAIGVGLSLLAILAMRSVVAPAPGLSFYRPTPDPVMLVAIAAVMAVAAVAAAALPARRAARLDPLSVIRHA